LDANRTVADIVQEILKHWPGEWQDKSDPDAPHEAGKLNLATDKASHLLGWQPRWDFSTTIEKTVAWYRGATNCHSPEEFSALTRRQIDEYQNGG
jgi:CDP-glucose 4,6-dehydratase